MLTFSTDVLRDFERASRLEWLETNGLGGWAGASLCLASTRRYHGLLVSASHTAAERSVIVAKLDETAAGIELGCNRYPGLIHPNGFEHLLRFDRGIFPVWEYALASGRLRKTVVCPNGENTTIVRYELLDAGAPIELRLRPFLAGRDSHSLQRRHDGPPPAVKVIVAGGRFEAAPDWYYNFVYDRERERGLDYQEDLFTPGEWSVQLAPGKPLDVFLTTEERPRGSLESERARREEFAADPLLLAADQFLVDRNDSGRGVIAGYHWFCEWGRDTMISLPGLCLATHRFSDARRILRRWLAAAKDGLIPNRFVEHGDPEFGAVDAGLWMFVAVWKYLRATGDHAFARSEAIVPLTRMIAALQRGVDGDLLHSGPRATWMDAAVDGVPVTPREGKAVDITALWYNALRIAAALTDDGALLQRAEAVRRAFSERFWNARAGCCFDVVDPDDPSIRPNQLLALALPFALIRGERAESVLRVCEQKLLTPAGLRSLAPDDPRYCGSDGGDMNASDRAYHQGTAWPWLLGPYISAAVRVRGEAGREEGRRLVAGMRERMGVAGVGSISEVFDGDPPHTPRRCIAQAWSVAEILRVIAEDLHGGQEDGTRRGLAHP